MSAQDVADLEWCWLIARLDLTCAFEACEQLVEELLGA